MEVGKGPDPLRDGAPRRIPASVLFACNHNAIRSPVAEALTRHFFGHKIYAESVGVRAGQLSPFAVAVLEEIGIDISKHKARRFEDLEEPAFDLVISLTPEAQHKAVDLAFALNCGVEYWPTFDPSLVEGSREVTMDAFRALRDDLSRRIRERFGAGSMASD